MEPASVIIIIIIKKTLGNIFTFTLFKNTSRALNKYLVAFGDYWFHENLNSKGFINFKLTSPACDSKIIFKFNNMISIMYVKY